MIKSFACHDTKRLFEHHKSLRFIQIERIALRKLCLLHAAVSLNDLTVPPGNKLEKLVGNRIGQYSIRINDQWRICFSWDDKDASSVEIVDYH